MNTILMEFSKQALKIAGKAFSSMGITFSTITLLKALFPSSKIIPDFTPFVAFSIFFAVILYSTAKDVWDLFFQRHSIKNQGRFISVRIGNILNKNNGTILVGINDTLCCDVDKIGKNSIQYQLIKKYGYEWMKRICTEEMKTNPPSNGKSYEFGHYFVGYSPDRRRNFVFFVMSTLGDDFVPDSSIPKIHKALAKFFASGNFRCDRGRLFMPILGTGYTGLPYSKEENAEMISFTFLQAWKELGTPLAVHDLVIVLRSHSLRTVNLSLLNNRIDLFISDCKNCPEKKLRKLRAVR